MPLPNALSQRLQRGRPGDLQLTTAIDTVQRMHTLLQTYLHLETHTTPFLAIVPLQVLVAATQHVASYLTTSTHATHPVHTPYQPMCRLCTDAQTRDALLNRLSSLNNISVRKHDGSFYPYLDLTILQLANTHPVLTTKPVKDAMHTHYLRFISGETGIPETNLQTMDPQLLHQEATKAFANRIARTFTPVQHQPIPQPGVTYILPQPQHHTYWNGFYYPASPTVSPVTPVLTGPYAQNGYYPAPQYVTDPHAVPTAFVLPRAATRHNPI